VRNGHAPEAEQLKVARIATVLIALFAIVLGVLFEGQNVAFMAGLAFSIACAANFPALVLSIVWRRFTTPAAVASILIGTISSLVLIFLSPTIQVDVLGKVLAQIEGAWWFVPLRNPAIICMPLSFIVAIVVSLVTSEKNADQTYNEMRHRVMFGAQPIMPPKAEPNNAIPATVLPAEAG
jgi:cation/acetate symporter